MIPTQTLGRFVRDEERRYKQTTGELTELLSSIGLATKHIASLVAGAGLKGLTGYTNSKNVQGEIVHQLDQQADQILFDVLGTSGHFALLVSEEQNKVIRSPLGRKSAQYVVAFDPLDGSSNLDSNIPVGTIFTIFRKKKSKKSSIDQDFLQRGRDVVAAGYAVYGSKISFVYSAGQGAFGFTLDHAIGEFVLTEPSIKCPQRGKIYSTNEGNSALWEPAVRRYVDLLKAENKAQGTPYSGRYAGSLVADFDRNLRKGGVFLYPADKKHTSGKLRLLYECVPLAFIAEQCGGRATNGKTPILDIVPKTIHERSPLVIGSRHEVELFSKIVK